MNKSFQPCLTRPILLTIILTTFVTPLDCDISLASTSVANTTGMTAEDIQPILGLLGSYQYKKLEAHYTDLQKRYDDEQSINDWQLLVQYQPFYNTNPAMEPLLTEWITQFPKSYPARLARGIYYRKVGETKRGSEWASKTPQANFEQLNKYLDLATDDLLASRPLTEKPIVSIVHLMNITRHRDGDLGNRYWLEEANRIDPLNYGARRRYIFTLTPRWGGSYEEMYAYLQECRFNHIPSEYIRIFEAIIHNDMADMERQNHKPIEAYTHYRQALMLLTGVENQETIETLRGLIYSARASNTLDRASDEMDRYLRLVPEDPKILSYRGWLREKRGQVAEALEDFKEAATRGHAWSQFRVGQHLLYNQSATIEETRQEGLAWLRRSAQQGYEPAQQLLQQVP